MLYQHSPPPAANEWGLEENEWSVFTVGTILGYRWRCAHTTAKRKLLKPELGISQSWWEHVTLCLVCGMELAWSPVVTVLRSAQETVKVSRPQFSSAVRVNIFSRLLSGWGQFCWLFWLNFSPDFGINQIRDTISFWLPFSDCLGLL